MSTDKRSEVAMKCLVVMLRAPPKRGVRGPQPSRECCIGYFFNECEVTEIDDTFLWARLHIIQTACI